MSDNNAFRPETIVIPVVATVSASAGTTNYDISTAVLPPGFYRLTLYVKANVTGTTTTITATPFADKAQTQISNGAFAMFQTNGATIVAAEGNITLPAGAIGRASLLTWGAPATNTAPQSTPIALLGGLRIAVAKGTAVTGELLQIVLVATRVY